MTRPIQPMLLVLCAALVLSGCATVEPGPHVDIQQVAQPDPVPDVSFVTPSPARPPTPPPTVSDTWRAWIPGMVQPNGDRIEGTWATFSLRAPEAETMAPPYTIPRVPHEVLNPRPKRGKPPETKPPTPPAAMQPPYPGMGQAPQLPYVPPAPSSRAPWSPAMQGIPHTGEPSFSLPLSLQGQQPWPQP